MFHINRTSTTMHQISTRFSIGVHILSLLDTMDGKRCSSKFIAGSVNTNPVIIRRLLRMLTQAGLINVERGTDGGAVLARPADKITMLDIYRAVGASDATLFHMHERTNPKCPVGANIQVALESTVDTAQQAMETVLAQQTLADITKDILRRNQS